MMEMEFIAIGLDLEMAGGGRSGRVNGGAPSVRPRPQRWPN
jgi:hypothetical protein